MTALEYVMGALLILGAVLVIAVVLLQEGRTANLGVISGAADSFMDKGKARTLDVFLSKWTKVISIVFFALVFAAMLITHFSH